MHTWNHGSAIRKPSRGLIQFSDCWGNGYPGHRGDSRKGFGGIGRLVGFLLVRFLAGVVPAPIRTRVSVAPAPVLSLAAALSRFVADSSRCCGCPGRVGRDPCSCRPGTDLGDPLCGRRVGHLAYRNSCSIRLPGRGKAGRLVPPWFPGCLARTVPPLKTSISLP